MEIHITHLGQPRLKRTEPTSNRGDLCLVSKIRRILQNSTFQQAPDLVGHLGLDCGAYKERLRTELHPCEGLVDPT